MQRATPAVHFATPSRAFETDAIRKCASIHSNSISSALVTFSGPDFDLYELRSGVSNTHLSRKFRYSERLTAGRAVDSVASCEARFPSHPPRLIKRLSRRQYKAHYMTPACARYGLRQE